MIAGIVNLTRGRLAFRCIIKVGRMDRLPIANPWFKPARRGSEISFQIVVKSFSFLLRRLVVHCYTVVFQGSENISYFSLLRYAIWFLRVT